MKPVFADEFAALLKSVIRLVPRGIRDRYRPAWQRLYRPVDHDASLEINQFLSRCKGVIHVGAHTGQERDTYSRAGLNVVWIEPIPEVFRELCKNVRRYRNQFALEYLVSDCNGIDHELFIANNLGESSSTLPFAMHKDIWPEIEYENSIRINGFTLPAIVEREKIDLDKYDALVIDTHGTELLVLQGARTILRRFKCIQVEAAEFEAYAGGCRLFELENFMHENGFTETCRNKFAEHPAGGGYFDVVYEMIDVRSNRLL